MEFSDDKWYAPLEKFPNQLFDNKDETIFRCRKKAKELLEAESEKARKKQRESDVGDAKWVRSMLNSGTLTDKMAAMTTLVQNDPVHNIDMVEELLAMANKKGKREAQLSIHSLRELFTMWILPDRPLRYFSQQPLEDESVDDNTLILFYYEHLVKQKYNEFLTLLKKYSYDTQEFFKKIANTSIYMLLEAKPEQEAILLAMLVDKLGDPDSKIASHIVYLLLQLVHEHPYMREIVAMEVKQQLVKNESSIKTIYYGITFLNQIEFTVEDNDFALSLISFYFSLFNKYSVLTLEHEKKSKVNYRQNKKSKKKAKEEKRTIGETNETRLKLIAAILTGINRAIPYGKVSEEEAAKQEDSLYHIVHLHNWSCSVQAMLLLYSLTTLHPTHAPRFYRLLYNQLLSSDFIHSSKNNLFLNLLYRVMKNCQEKEVLYGLMKRVLQCCLMMSAAMACGMLFLLSTVLSERNEIKVDGKLKEMMEKGVFEGLISREDKEEILEGVQKKKQMKQEKQEKQEKQKQKQKQEEMQVEEESGKEVEEEGDDVVEDLDDAFFDKEEEVKSESESEPEPEPEPEPELEPEPEPEPVKEAEPAKTPLVYAIAARDPGYSNSMQTLFYELVLLVNHYHPTVAHFASLLLANMRITCPGDPLKDYSNKAFLDKFAYKHAKQKDIENARQKGTTSMQSKKQASSIMQEPVNSETFLKKKEEDVAVEDRFFYQFFKERARREGGRKKNKKAQEEEEDDEEAMDRFAENLAEEMMNQRVGSEDDDFLDDFEDHENGAFLEDGEEIDDLDLSDDMGDMDEDDLEDDGHMIVDEFGKKPKKKDSSKSIYASAEEFEAMLAATAEEASQKQSERKSQKRGFKGKKSFNKRRK